MRALLVILLFTFFSWALLLTFAYLVSVFVVPWEPVIKTPFEIFAVAALKVAISALLFFSWVSLLVLFYYFLVGRLTK